MAAATGAELTERMDALVKTFTVIGQQIKDMQEAVVQTATELKEVKIEQKAQGIRMTKIEQEINQDHHRIALMEDRLRRANIRLRGFKGDFADSRNMIQNIQQWFKEYKIEIQDYQIERVHWIFGTRRDGNQRDIIIKFLSERTAEATYKELKKVTNLNFKGAPIRVLKDLSAQTLQARSQMRPITNALFKGDIRFSWQYPATIIVFQEGRMYRARSLEEGKGMLTQLGLDLDLKQQAEKATEVVEASGAVGGEGVKSMLEFLPSALPTKETEIRALEQQLALLKERGRERDIQEDPSKTEGRITRQKKK